MIYHHCLNIERGLMCAGLLKGAIQTNGETLVTKRQIIKFLKSQRKIGRKVLPICECNNFDYQKGCLGHDD